MIRWRKATTVIIGALWPGMAMAQQLGQGGGHNIPFWRIAVALALCLALAVAAIFVLRQRLRGMGTLPKHREGRLQLVDTLRLSHQVDLCVVRYGRRKVLVAVHPHGADFPPAGSESDDEGKMA